MIISQNHKFIFAGIGRSAATSMHEALKKYHDYNNKIGKHVPFSNVENIIPNFDSYYKFCIFRNPWDIAVSKYFYHGSIKCNHKKGYGGIEVCKNAREMPFADWAAIPDHLDIFYETPIKTFKQYISNSNGQILADCVYNFSYLDHMTEDLQNIFNIKINLPILNTTNHLNYWEYHNEKTIQVIADKFKWAINLINFKYMPSKQERIKWKIKK